MPKAEANQIQIEYETFGDKKDKPLILIMGLASQLVMWDEEFCSMLVEKGHYVIRFDNRDVGLSSKIDGAGIPDVIGAMKAVMQGEKINPPYSIEDMGDDVIGLMDALDIKAAHICGASMGGMIAQSVAINHPTRILSLTSIMSSTGEAGLPQGKPQAMQALMTPPPGEPKKFIEHYVKVWKTIGSPGFPFDEERIRRLSSLTFKRGYNPIGVMRQLVAVVAQKSRKEALSNVKIPALVIHGKDDPLVPVQAGESTAESIPGAKLLVIDGMGHDLPREAWPRIIDAISGVTGSA